MVVPVNTDPDIIGTCYLCRLPVEYGVGWVLMVVDGASQLVHSSCQNFDSLCNRSAGN
jgi:hypothetical protein